jgi:putative glutamine amidotransferase
MTPLVGLTTYTPPGSEKRTYSIPAEYVDSLRAAGAEVVLLAAGDADACLAPLDGLVLSGGGDIDPSVYGGSTHEKTYLGDRKRDEFEIALLRRALDLAMPVLAICRGMQILNVALGGSLIAHVPEAYGESVIHRMPPREPTPHVVELEACASRLADAAGREGSLDVVSWHHQAVDRLGDGLRITARASDGLVEALEPEGGHWVVGVQWHPELNAAGNVRQAALLRAFRDAASSYRHDRGNREEGTP